MSAGVPTSSGQPPVLGEGRRQWLRHHRISLALHELRGGTGRPLLCLHGLGSRTPSSIPERYAAWPGPVYGLDFTGHGESTVPTGGGYSAELLMGDADHALAVLGPSTVVGEGLGGYVAALLAGARPQLVRGAIVADGPGLSGGSFELSTMVVLETPGSPRMNPDPWALWELARDPRPPDYVISYLRQALILSGLDCPIIVSARIHPPWLRALCADPAVTQAPVGEALAIYAGI